MVDIKQIKLSQKNLKAICEMLDDSNWKYDKDEENFIIYTGTKGNDLTIGIRFHLKPDLEVATLYSPMPFEVPENKRSIMALAVSRVNYEIVAGAIVTCFANYCLADGSFDLDITCGNVMNRITTSCRNSYISAEALIYLMDYAAWAIDKYVKMRRAQIAPAAFFLITPVICRNERTFLLFIALHIAFKSNKCKRRESYQKYRNRNNAQRRNIIERISSRFGKGMRSSRYNSADVHRRIEGHKPAKDLEPAHRIERHPGSA